MTQNDMVLKHMQEYGPITPLDALKYYGCMRLGARIYELRRQGYRIKKDTITEKGRFGSTVSYAKYSLEEQNG